MLLINVSEQICSPWSVPFNRATHIFYMTALVVLFTGLSTGVCFPQTFSPLTNSLGLEKSGFHISPRSEGKTDNPAVPEPLESSLKTASEKDIPPAIIQMTTSLNYRRDTLDWNIAGQKDGTNPNILSELTWDNLEIYELSVGLQVQFGNHLYFKGDMNFGVIVDGENQDSDYNADNRQDEFSRSNNSADEGVTFDTSAGIGYVFSLASDQFVFIPLTGLSLHRQYLTMTDGYQTIYTDDPSLEGPFDGLDSSYDTQWFGPWVGFLFRFNFDVDAGFLQRIVPEGGLEYHWARYYAQADWNLRSDFDHPKSFEHEAWGSGFLTRVGLGFEFQGNWSLVLGYVQQDWRAEDGVDRVFLSNGGTVETRLNEVYWGSRSICLEFMYQF